MVNLFIDSDRIVLRGTKQAKSINLFDNNYKSPYFERTSSSVINVGLYSFHFERKCVGVLQPLYPLLFLHLLLCAYGSLVMWRSVADANKSRKSSTLPKAFNKFFVCYHISSFALCFTIYDVIRCGKTSNNQRQDESK